MGEPPRTIGVPMAAPTPIHRDPDADGDDYGCIGRNAKKGNVAIAKFVTEVCDRLSDGEFEDGEELIDFVREHLAYLDNLYDCGSCNTVVKENVFCALQSAVESAGLEDVDPKQIYGW